ncbi:hypothetical protein A2U01_0081686, partial [Trifolium medium]|nr:hypothetical protein [Trifolium medium]
MASTGETMAESFGLLASTGESHRDRRYLSLGLAQRTLKNRYGRYLSLEARSATKHEH